MLSFWEKDVFLQYTHIIVGSGIVGMSTAIEIKSKYPSAKILILERSIFPYGASSRNAGFACVGNIPEYLDDSFTMNDSEIQSIFQKRYQGLQILRNRLGDEHIAYRERGSHDLLTKDEEFVLEEIDRFNDLFYPIMDKKVFSLNNSYINDSGLNSDYFSHCIECLIDGEIHTGKMLTALHQLCLENGIVIKTGSFVKEYEHSENKASVYVYDNAREECIKLGCEKLIFCTNAFTKDFFPEEDIQPGRGQVVITKEIPNLRLKGIHHFHKGYYYFREIDGRILFGGGRQLDFEKERTTEMSFNEDILENLKWHLQKNILPNHPTIEIDMQWTGIMAFGENKFPLLIRKSASLWCAARLGGMGVAIGSLLARELVEKMEEG